MNLGQFHAEVSGIIARGTSLDARIPGETRRAARWLEENYDFLHMQRVTTFTASGVETTLSAMGITLAVKKFEGFRYLQAGVYGYATQQDFGDQYDQSVGVPTAYYKIGSETKIRWNKTISPAISIEGLYVAYTTWPTSTSATVDLIDNAEGLLLAQTLMRMAASMRDVGLLQLYTAQRDEQLRSVLLAQDAAVNANRSEFFGRVVE